ncbi:MAG: penicillin-binding protein 2 [Aquificae bacterium]|nr:penicillin-binding protein 2 [Aquificota bacterium]
MSGLRNKFLYLYLFFLFSFLLLGFRYFQVQVLLDEEVFKKLKKYYSEERTIVLPGWRGVIYTADGVPVALTIGDFVYYAITDRLSDEAKRLYAKRFSSVFDLPPGTLLKVLNSKSGYLEILKDPDEGLHRRFKKVRYELWKEQRKKTREVFGEYTTDPEKIRSFCEGLKRREGAAAFVCAAQEVLDWTGVNAANRRVYPHGRFLANTVGFVNSKNFGRAGVELMEDENLYAGPVKIPYHYGIKIKGVDAPAYRLFEKNLTADVYLTIDWTVQAILEETKERIVKRWNPKKVVIMLMDAYDGRILGLAVYPDFDPNRPFRNWQEFMNSRNPAFMDVFEMGSVIKPFFVGLALYKGRIGFNATVYINGGKTKIGGHTVRDAERLYTDRLSVREVLVHSSNVGVVQVARTLKKEDEEWLVNLLGWNRKISDFPGSTSGLIPNLNLPANRLYVAFGQGLALTPAHLVSSYAALLTGYAPVPQLVEKVVREDGKVIKTFEPKFVNEEPLFDERTRSWLLETLRLIVVRGTGKKANPYYYAVGGKTGTAQVFDKKLGRYSPDRYVTSFIGFFPYPEPRFVLLVLVDEPKAPRKGLLYGGTVAAPYWADVVNRVSSYLLLKPSPDRALLKRRR